MLHVATYMQEMSKVVVVVVVVAVVVKLLRWSFVVLNAHPNALDEPVQCFFADVFGKQMCAVAECVDLKDSNDVVLDEVLCREI